MDTLRTFALVAITAILLLASADAQTVSQVTVFDRNLDWRNSRGGAESPNQFSSGFPMEVSFEGYAENLDPPPHNTNLIVELYTDMPESRMAASMEPIFHSCNSRFLCTMLSPASTRSSRPKRCLARRKYSMILETMASSIPSTSWSARSSSSHVPVRSFQNPAPSFSPAWQLFAWPVCPAPIAAVVHNPLADVHARANLFTSTRLRARETGFVPIAAIVSLRVEPFPGN